MMVEGREDSASPIKVVLMSLSGRYSSHRASGMHQAVCGTHRAVVAVMLPLISHGEKTDFDLTVSNSLQAGIYPEEKRTAKRPRQRGDEAKQSKFFSHLGRKDISFRSHALQTHSTNPYFQGISIGNWLQHLELLRKASVRREI